MLTGVAPSASSQSRPLKTRAVTPKGGDPSVPDGVVVAEGRWISVISNNHQILPRILVSNVSTWIEVRIRISKFCFLC